MSRLAHPADRIATGSAIVARRLGARAAAWCARGRRDDLTGWRGKLGNVLRGLVALLGGYLLWRLVRAVPNLLWLLSGAWLIASWRVGKQAPTEPVEEPPSETPESTTGEAWRAFIVRAISDRQGVHLRDLLATLHQAGHHPHWGVADVRRVCERAGVPVRARVRVRGEGVTVGVHRDDLPTPSSPSPEAPSQETPEPEPHAS